MLKKSLKNNSTIKEHLRELRHRVFTCLLWMLVVFFICFHYSNDILKYLLSLGGNMQFVYLYPQEIFLQNISVSATIAILVTLPLTMMECALFIIPAVAPHKRKNFIMGVVFANILFYIGMTFAFKIVIPFIINYFYGVNDAVEVQGAVSVEKFISLIKGMLLGFGVVFEIPIISYLLGSIGIASSEKMRKYRKVVIVLAFIIGAFMTPPDVISQCMVALPTILLYEVSILLVKHIERKEAAKEEITKVKAV